jgi:uncharacterized membrane protein
MSFAVRQSCEIGRSAEVVWAYLIALEQVPLWEHGVVDVRLGQPGPPQLGTEVLGPTPS